MGLFSKVAGLVASVVFFSIRLSAAEAPAPFDVPRLEGIQIDGQTDDWGEKGFRVDLLATAQGEIRAAKDLDARFRLGWDDLGLLVRVAVRDQSVAEAPKADDLYARDSVEFFLGDRPGSARYFQVLSGTGADPAFPKVRSVAKLPPGSTAPAKEAAEIAARPTAGGYVIEARIPWKNLALMPRMGAEAAFQLAVNDSDPDQASPDVLVWFPSRDAFLNSNALQPLRLSDHAAPPVRWLARAVGGGELSIVAPAELDGRRVEIKSHTGSSELAVAARLSRDSSGHASALVPLVPSSVQVTAEGESRTSTTDLKVDSAPGETFRVAFKPAVFSGKNFPPVDFVSPAEVRAAIGPTTIEPTFYDADYREVTTADRPGRYGAVVRFRTPDGRTFTHFATLYRAAGEIQWRDLNLPVRAQFPPKFGLDDAVVKERSRSLDDLFRQQLRASFEEPSSAAIYFAGLSEMKAGTEPVRERNDEFARDQRWWFGLKNRLGLLRRDEFVHLPPGYESEPKKRWPLILFLHGSGERGNDVASILGQGLPAALKNRPDLPAIVVAPQCPFDEWWSNAVLNDLLDRMEAKYRVDPDRIILTGLSMGGYATWSLAAEFPSRFAALVPICGGGDPADAARFKDVPTWVFHGGKDGAVPIKRSEEMVAALRKAGSRVKFTVFPEAGHDSWTAAYAMPELYDWMLAQRRGAAPAQ